MIALEVLGCNEKGILFRAMNYTITLTDEEAAVIMDGLSQAITTHRRETKVAKEEAAARECAEEGEIDAHEIDSEPRP